MMSRHHETEMRYINQMKFELLIATVALFCWLMTVGDMDSVTRSCDSRATTSLRVGVDTTNRSQSLVYCITYAHIWVTDFV